MLGKLTQKQIDYILRREVVGRIACYAEKNLYIVPVTYVFHDGYIYAHSKEGLKINMMRKNPNVCFEVDSIENLANWRSVIIWGKYEELKTEKQQKVGMKIIADTLVPLASSQVARPSVEISHPPEIVQKPSRAVFYRIKVKEKTGRYEKTVAL